MTEILATIAKSREQFQPATPREYIGLQIARKLGDLANVREYLILLEHYPENLVVKAFRQTCQGGRLEKERFLAEFRKITNQTSHEADFGY